MGLKESRLRNFRERNALTIKILTRKGEPAPSAGARSILQLARMAVKLVKVGVAAFPGVDPQGGEHH